jgi:hypothetical protein
MMATAILAGMAPACPIGATVRASTAADTGVACDADRPVLPALRLHLVDRAGLPRATREVLMEETLRPWHAVGGQVDWAIARPNAEPAGHNESMGERAAVYLIVHEDRLPDSGTVAAGRFTPLAAIRFVDGRPTTHLVADARQAARLVDGVPTAFRDGRPQLVRDRLIGRVLGRALAHELGHFLLGTATHTPEGLMRASHRAEHLVAPSHPAFQVQLPPAPPCLAARVAPNE